jgi:hypothetical protein
MRGVVPLTRPLMRTPSPRSRGARAFLKGFITPVNFAQVNKLGVR